MPPSREYCARQFDEHEFDVSSEVRDVAIDRLQRIYTACESEESTACQLAEYEVEAKQLKARIAELERELATHKGAAV
jgi:U3 small nucleolar ribonucleoprotein component